MKSIRITLLAAIIYLQSSVNNAIIYGQPCVDDSKLPAECQGHTPLIEDLCIAYVQTLDAHLKGANELSLSTGPFISSRSAWALAVYRYIQSMECVNTADVVWSIKVPEQLQRRRLFDLEDYATTYRANRQAHERARNEFLLSVPPYNTAREQYVDAFKSCGEQVIVRKPAQVEYAQEMFDEANFLNASVMSFRGEDIGYKYRTERDKYTIMWHHCQSAKAYGNDPIFTKDCQDLESQLQNLTNVCDSYIAEYSKYLWPIWKTYPEFQTHHPTNGPTANPTHVPTTSPTTETPTSEPTSEPTANPTHVPTTSPSTETPTSEPTVNLTEASITIAPTSAAQVIVRTETKYKHSYWIWVVAALIGFLLGICIATVVRDRKKPSSQKYTPSVSTTVDHERYSQSSDDSDTPLPSTDLHGAENYHAFEDMNEEELHLNDGAANYHAFEDMNEEELHLNEPNVKQSRKDSFVRQMEKEASQPQWKM